MCQAQTLQNILGVTSNSQQFDSERSDLTINLVVQLSKNVVLKIFFYHSE